MTDRTDLTAWMTGHINAAIPTEGVWNARAVAEKLVARLEETEPDVFADWLRVNGVRAVHQVVGDRARSDRARQFAQARASAFNDATVAAEDGDPAALDPYLTWFTVDDNDGDRMPIGDMTRSELRSAAANYEDRAKRNRMAAAFLKAVAKRTPEGQRVRDVIDAAQLQQMMHDLLGGDDR